MSEHSISVRFEGRSLILEFPPDNPPVAASWAVLGGGITLPKAIVNHTIAKGEWIDDPYQYAGSVLRRHMLPVEGSVVLLTTVPQDFTGYAREVFDKMVVEAWATVGLGNALAAGDEGKDVQPHIAGTINLIVLVHASLSTEALLQSISIATEAKSLCLFRRGVQSTESESPATGTGTDCVVVSSFGHGRTMYYAGKHSKLGELIAQATIKAMEQSLEQRHRSKQETGHVSS